MRTLFTLSLLILFSHSFAQDDFTHISYVKLLIRDQPINAEQFKRLEFSEGENTSISYEEANGMIVYKSNVEIPQLTINYGEEKMKLQLPTGKSYLETLAFKAGQFKIEEHKAVVYVNGGWEQQALEYTEVSSCPQCPLVVYRQADVQVLSGQE